jgi:hypothetical protein
MPDGKISLASFACLVGNDVGPLASLTNKTPLSEYALPRNFADSASVSFQHKPIREIRENP